MSYEQRRQTAESPKRPGSLTLEGRKHLTVSGVEEVVSFDEREISMRTGDGDLTVRGEGMSISELSAGGGDLHVRYTDETVTLSGEVLKVYDGTVEI